MNHELFARIFLTNIHSYTENVLAYALTIAYSPNFSSFTCMVHQPTKYFPYTVCYSIIVMMCFFQIINQHKKGCGQYDQTTTRHAFTSNDYGGTKKSLGARWADWTWSLLESCLIPYNSLDSIKSSYAWWKLYHKGLLGNLQSCNMPCRRYCGLGSGLWYMFNFCIANWYNPLSENHKFPWPVFQL